MSRQRTDASLPRRAGTRWPLLAVVASHRIRRPDHGLAGHRSWGHPSGPFACHLGTPRVAGQDAGSAVRWDRRCPYFTQLTDAQVTAEVQGAQQAILRANGADARPLFRFPFGDVNSRVLGDVNSLGYVAVRCTVDSLGWEGASGGQSVQSVTNRVLAAAQPGEIVLMHLGSNPDVRAGNCDTLIERLGQPADADPPLLLQSHPVTKGLAGQPSPVSDPAYKHREDLIDALLCAWTASLWARHGFDRCQVLGLPDTRTSGPATTMIVPARPQQRLQPLPQSALPAAVEEVHLKPGDVNKYGSAGRVANRSQSALPSSADPGRHLVQLGRPVRRGGHEIFAAEHFL